MSCPPHPQALSDTVVEKSLILPCHFQPFRCSRCAPRSAAPNAHCSTMSTNVDLQMLQASSFTAAHPRGSCSAAPPQVLHLLQNCTATIEPGHCSRTPRAARTGTSTGTPPPWAGHVDKPQHLRSLPHCSDRTCECCVRSGLLMKIGSDQVSR